MAQNDTSNRIIVDLRPQAAQDAGGHNFFHVGQKDLRLSIGKQVDRLKVDIESATAAAEAYIDAEDSPKLIPFLVALNGPEDDLTEDARAIKGLCARAAALFQEVRLLQRLAILSQLPTNDGYYIITETQAIRYGIGAE